MEFFVKTTNFITRSSLVLGRKHSKPKTWITRLAQSMVTGTSNTIKRMLKKLNNSAKNAGSFIKFMEQTIRCLPVRFMQCSFPNALPMKLHQSGSTTALGNLLSRTKKIRFCSTPLSMNIILILFATQAERSHCHTIQLSRPSEVIHVPIHSIG